MQKITPDQLRRARRAIGITQATLADGAGVNVTFIKHFETYRIDNLPPDYQRKLVDYFAGQGVDITSGDATPGVSASPSLATVPRGAIPVPPGTAAPRMSFVVSERLSDSEVEGTLARMDENDEEIAVLMGKVTSKNLFGGYTDETVLDSQRLFGLMAENYMLFRYLQGRNFLTGIDPEASDETHGHVVQRAASDSPLVVPSINGSSETEDQQAMAEA